MSGKASRRSWLVGVAGLLLAAMAALWSQGGVPAPLGPGAWPLADEEAILAARPDAPAVFRLAGNPRVLVVVFPTLAEQGAMLNRVAALVEKAGQPRNRVLDDAELTRAIAASGATAETYYYGHDYRATDLYRFFALADRDRIALNPEERRLREWVRAAGWDAPAPAGALVSIPAGGGRKVALDPSARASILRHELSHGEYFTNPAYAAYVRAFWTSVMDERQRTAFRRMLNEKGYDPTNNDLTMNEMQASLVHSPDQRFFNAARVGLDQAEVDGLRQRFIAGMPLGWLRETAAKAPRASATRFQRNSASRTPQLGCAKYRAG